MAGDKPAVDANSPQEGYYRKRDGRDGPWVPVLIRRGNDGELRAFVGLCHCDEKGNPVFRVDDPARLWTWVAGNAVSKEAAGEAARTGKWPGDIEVTPTPSIGDNSGILTPIAELVDVLAQAASFRAKNPIKDEITAGAWVNWAGKIDAVAKVADAEWTELAKPFEDELAKLKERYDPSLKDAKEVVQTLRRTAREWIVQEKDRREAEARRKTEEMARLARLEAERRAEEERAKIARAAKEAEAQGQAEVARELAREAETVTVEPIETPVYEAPKVIIGGQHGKRISHRKTTTYVINDFAAVVAALINEEDFKAAVQDIVNKRGKAGNILPGVEKRVA